MSEKPDHVQKQRDSKEAKRNRYENQKNVDAINAIADTLAENQKEQSRSEDRKSILEKLTIALLVVTVALTYFTLSETQRATIEANRAWVEIPEIRLLAPPGPVGSHFSYYIFLRNYGRDPAINVSFQNLETGTLKRSANGAEMDPAPPYDRCEGVIGPSEKGTLVFPNQKDVEETVETPDGQKIRKPVGPSQIMDAFDNGGTVVTQGLKDNSEVFYVRGCAVYKTLGVVGRTSFCHIEILPQNSVSNSGVALTCPHGSSAE